MEFKIEVRDTVDLRKASHAMKAIAAEAAGRAAEFFAEHARGYCPVDTGFLRDSITVIPAGDDSFTVIAWAEYAQYVEFGYTIGTTWVAPQPFMRMALADTATAFPRICSEAEVAMANHLGATFKPAG